jgi:anti-sigma factor RsiW
MLRPVAAPDLLRARVRAALRGQAGSATIPELKPVIRRSRWIPQLVAGLIIAAASSGVTTLALLYRRSPAESLGREVVASHTRSLMTNHLTDIASADQHNVKPWFNGKVDFSPDVYRLDDAGFPLIGGRVDHVGKHAAAVLVYGRRKHVIDVFTWPGESANAPPSGRVTEERDRGYNVLHWSGDGMYFWAVSDLNIDELREFVEAFRKGEKAPTTTAPATTAPARTAPASTA